MQSYPEAEAMRRHHAEEWQRQIINAGGDENVALQAVTLAALNGLFDHLVPAQEPVAYRYHWSGEVAWTLAFYPLTVHAGAGVTIQPLYAAPQSVHHAQAVQSSGAPTQEYVLRAMAANYADGNSWDHLDREAVTKAADEIKSLRDHLISRSAQENLLAKRAAEFIRTTDPFGDHFSAHDLQVLAGKTAPNSAEPLCERCMGSGYSNHPDSGEVCRACSGQGVVLPSTEGRSHD